MMLIPTSSTSTRSSSSQQQQLWSATTRIIPFISLLHKQQQQHQLQHVELDSTPTTSINTSPNDVPIVVTSFEKSSIVVSSTTTGLLQQQQQQQKHIDDVMEQLIHYGFVMIDISSNNTNYEDVDDESYHHQTRSIPETTFATARCVMDHIQIVPIVVSSSPPPTATTAKISIQCPMIESTNTNMDAAHIYGYHKVGGMISNRYNMYREGFIFSDHHSSYDVVLVQDNNMTSSTIDDNTTNTTTTTTLKSISSFRENCTSMFTLLHTIADTVLTQIALHLQLPSSESLIDTNDIGDNYFQQMYGPTLHECQWHIKRYSTTHDEVSVCTTDIDDPVQKNTSVQKQEPQQPMVILPTHTDPSLLSVVILDQKHIQRGAMGLQCLLLLPPNNNISNNNEPAKDNDKVWVEIPYSGHDIAIVFVGSVLQKISNGYFTAVKHRVIAQDTQQQRQRMAATLFCRPKPSAILHTLPSTKIPKMTSSSTTSAITFDQWISKTSKNYQKSQKL